MYLINIIYFKSFFFFKIATSWIKFFCFSSSIDTLLNKTYTKIISIKIIAAKTIFAVEMTPISLATKKAICGKILKIINAIEQRIHAKA